jgi:probable phosphoglycerate mutase
MLRHAQSVSNAQKEVATLSDEKGDRLTERGWDQARNAARALEDRGFTRLIASPMRRAQETAQPISEALGLPIETDEDIYELREEEGYGLLPPEEQKLRRWSEWMVQHADDPAYAPPGADSFQGMRKRARGLMQRMESEQGMPLDVTHGILLRFILIDILLGDRFGPADAARLWQMRTVNCGLSAFDYRVHHRAADHDADDWQCAMWRPPLGDTPEA